MNFWTLFLVCGWLGHKPVDSTPFITYEPYGIPKKASFAVFRCARCRAIYWDEVAKALEGIEKGASE